MCGVRETVLELAKLAQSKVYINISNDPQINKLMLLYPVSQREMDNLGKVTILLSLVLSFGGLL